MAMSRSYHLQNPQRWGRSYQAFQGGRFVEGIEKPLYTIPESSGVLRSPGVPGLSIEGFGVITDYLMIEMGWVVPGPAVTGIDQLCPARRPGDVVTSQNHTIGCIWIPLVLKYGWKIFSSFVNDFPTQMIFGCCGCCFVSAGDKKAARLWTDLYIIIYNNNII